MRSFRLSPRSFTRLAISFCSFAFMGLSLSGCLSVSHPFAHRDASSRLLADGTLPPPRLAVPVPVPKNAPWQPATALWVQDMVVALLGQSLPAVNKKPRDGDWWVRLGAMRDNGRIKPRYALVDPDGIVRAVGYGDAVERAEWLKAEPDLLNIVALQMAPKIAADLTGIQAQIMQGDPQSLMNRPAHIYFAGVKGAPGDGNLSLGRAFYSLFPDGRNQIQQEEKGADYIVNTEVTLETVSKSALPKGSTATPHGKAKPSAREAPADNVQVISVVWHVRTVSGKDLGRAVQIHEIMMHSLDGAWGDVATLAAQEAAGAVRTIITNYSGRDHKPLSLDAQKKAALQDKEEAAQVEGPDVDYVDGPDVGLGKPLQMPPNFPH